MGGTSLQGLGTSEDANRKEAEVTAAPDKLRPTELQGFLGGSWGPKP